MRGEIGKGGAKNRDRRTHDCSSIELRGSTGVFLFVLQERRNLEELYSLCTMRFDCKSCID